MPPRVTYRRSPCSRVVLIALCAANMAGCSADTTRLSSNPFSGSLGASNLPPAEVTSSIPAGAVTAQQFPPPSYPSVAATGAPPTPPYRPASLPRSIGVATSDAKLLIGQRLSVPGVTAAHINGAAKTAGQPVTTKQARVQPPSKPQKVASTEPAASVNLVSPAAESPATESDTGTGTPSFRWPARGRVIAGFGAKTGGQKNNGINLSILAGTPVKVAEDGVVAYAGNELKGYGNLVLIRHSGGYVTAYAHASEVIVKRGDRVTQGQIIARAGQTGDVTAPQLHFEIRKGSTPIDPMQFLQSSPADL